MENATEEKTNRTDASTTRFYWWLACGFLVLVLATYIYYVRLQAEKDAIYRRVLNLPTININFQQTPILEALEEIHAKACESDPLFKNIPFRVEGINSTIPISLRMKNAGYYEALKYSSSLAGADWQVRPEEVIICPRHFDARDPIERLFDGIFVWIGHRKYEIEESWNRKKRLPAPKLGDPFSDP